MAEHTIELARSPGLPAGFSLVSERVDGATVYYVRRDMDDRRARVVWKDGTEYYTAQWLSSQMSKEADYDNPLLKNLV